MRSAKHVLNYKQQKIQEILQTEKLNGNDLTKKEIIDKIRRVLEEDYQNSEYQKEKRLRDEEIKRIRKLRMDGKITAEEEEYLIQSAHKNDSSKFKLVTKTKEVEEKTGFNQEFQANPTFTHRTRSLTVPPKAKEKALLNAESKDSAPKKEKKQVDSNSTSANEKTTENTENAETDEIKEEIKDEIIDENANEDVKEINEENETKDNKETENDTPTEENKENIDDHQLKREYTETTLTLINENDMDKLYDLAEKMIFLSSKK